MTTPLPGKDDSDATDNADSGLATGSNAPRRPPDRTLEAAIGEQTRKLRLRHGMTAAELAREADVSTGMLSKIENGGISPSLTTLKALAAALNVPIAALFESSEDQRDVSFVKAGQGVVIERRGTKAGHAYELLGHSLGGPVAMEPYLITLTPEAEPYPHFQHDGIELLYMLQGEMGYRHGERTFTLRPGDSLFFDAAAPHGPEILPPEETVRFLSIIVYGRD